MNDTKQLLNGTQTIRVDEKVIFIGLGLTLLSLLIICGNLIVIRVYKRDRELQVPKNYFIVSLAIADLLVGIFSINPYTIYLVEGYWPLGEITCQAWLTLDHTLFTISNLTLLMVAVDRFTSICFPWVYRIKFKPKYVKRAIITTWVVPIFVWAPAILIYNHAGLEVIGEEGCDVRFYQGNVNVTITVAFFSYFGIVLFLTLLYIAVSIKIANRKQKSLRKRIKITSTGVPSTDSVICNNESDIVHPDSDSTNDHRGRGLSTCNLLKERTCTVESSSSNNAFTIDSGIVAAGDIIIADTNEVNSSKNLPNIEINRGFDKHETRALRLILLVSVAFILSWMPYHVTIIVRAASGGDNIPEPWWKFCYIVGWMNSLFNPICYAYANPKFKKGFRRTLFRPYRHENAVLSKVNPS